MLMLQCKRDEYDVNPLTKKMKINDELSSTESSTDYFMENNQLNVSNLSQISQQSTSMIFPNRKRRSRNTQYFYENDSSMCSSDGQLRKRPDLSCVVCCAIAHGYNFDAISCESCKAFFRRNALFSLDRLKCRRDGNCEITVESRRRCKACRLKKCFAVGMRKEWILTEEEKLNKKRRIEENRKLRDNNPNELISPRNSLSKLDFDIKTTNYYQTKKFTSTDDLITNLVMIYNDHINIDLTGYGWSYSLARKIVGLCPLINTRSNTALRLISFFKRLYDFDILNEADKINLLKANLPYVFFLHGSLNYDPIQDVYHQENVADKPWYGIDIRDTYGIDCYRRLTEIMRTLNSIIQIDKRIIQVAIVILLFSKGLSITIHSYQPSGNNHQEIFHTQNKYVEQLWLFIEKLYGQIHAINIFSTLISKFLIIQELTRDIQHDLYEKIDSTQISNMCQTLIQSI